MALFPSNEDYLARITLLHIVVTKFPPSILFLDKIWEMYDSPFSVKLIQGVRERRRGKLRVSRY